MPGLQQPGSSTPADPADSRFTKTEKNLNAISKMVKNPQIKATYDSNNSKMKQDFTSFCTNCKSGHTIKICWSLKKKKLNDERTLLQSKET